MKRANETSTKQAMEEYLGRSQEDICPGDTQWERDVCSNLRIADEIDSLIIESEEELNKLNSRMEDCKGIKDKLEFLDCVYKP